MSLIHWDKAFALEQAADDAELLAELLQIFKESLRSDIALIETGILEKSPNKVAGAAHSIKGAAASLGLVGVNQLARMIEEESRKGNLNVAKERLPILQKMLLEVRNL